MKFLSDIKVGLTDKVVIVRTDLNIQSGEEKNAFRLVSALPTIKFLLKKGAKVVITSHRGRPNKKDSKLSLKIFKPVLEKRLGQKIVFIGDFNFTKARSLIASSSNKLFLLENVRFVPAEEKNSPVFAKGLASLGDIYVNDAFAVSHRANATVSAITRFLPSYAGLLMEKEIRNLRRLNSPKRPFVAIVGGAKVSDKIKLIRHFLKKADYLLVGGGIANTFFLADNIPVGNSIYDKEAVPFVKSVMKNPKIIKPIDGVVANKKILDVGAETSKLFKNYVKKARTIVWNGPLGLIENKKFSKGTADLAKVISESGAFSVVGGGETADFIIESGLEDKISFLSTGGGAMLEYLSGDKLPGLEALK